MQLQHMLEIVVQVHSATYIIGIDLVMLLVEIFFEFFGNQQMRFFGFLVAFLEIEGLSSGMEQKNPLSCTISLL